MTTLQALKSIQDIQIIISPKDFDKEQEIINLSFKNEDWNKSFNEFINSKYLLDIVYSLTYLKNGRDCKIFMFLIKCKY